VTTNGRHLPRHRLMTVAQNIKLIIATTTMV